jgi:hypothetical protein
MKPHLALLSLLCWLGCAKATPPAPDKSTHWLRVCDRDAECGSDLACLCGVCSLACEAEASCGARGAARCVETDSASLRSACGDDPPAPAICAQRCADNQACGPGLACVEGACVAQAAPPRPVSCEPGTYSLARCDSLRCTELNAVGVARCEDDAQYGECQCAVPREGCAALDCATGYQCYAGRCLPTSRCGTQACEEGWTCWDGSVCGQVLASGESRPIALALQDDQVYFANGGTFAPSGGFNGDSGLKRVPLEGGPAVMLAGDVNPILHLALTPMDAYWVVQTNDDGHQLMHMELAGTAPSALLGGIHVSDSFVDSGANLFWIDDSRLMEVLMRPGATPNMLAEPASPPTSLVVFRFQLYWGDATRGLWRAELDGTNAMLVAEANAEIRTPARLAQDGTALYWLWSDADSAGVSIYSWSRAQAVMLGRDASVGGRTPVAIATHAQNDHVYWLVQGDSGYVTLYGTHKQSGETRYLWGTQRLTRESAIAVSSEAIYVTNPGSGAADGEVLRVQQLW